MDLLTAFAGLALLLAAGDLLVRGAVALAFRLAIPPMVVGLTVVAFGTSAPELFISVRAALGGQPGIAIGNVVGSNIANVLLVLGLPALFATITPAAGESRRSYFQMLAASALLIALCFLGPLHLWHAAVLLGLFALMLFDTLRAGRDAAPGALDDIGSLRARPSPARLAAFLLAGLAGLPLGAGLLVDGAVGIAQSLGVSPEVIGLTMVAVGTSLPEFATTLIAALRGHTAVAIGNVIGSNLFNILSILGITSLFGPLPVDAGFLARDLWVMLAAALLLGPFVLRPWPIGRVWGSVFLLAYVGYTISLFIGGSAAA